MTRIEQVVREISELYDVYLAFRAGRKKAGIPMDPPIPGMSHEEFEAFRQEYMESLKETDNDS